MDCINFNTIKINSTDFYDVWLLETGDTIPLKAKLVLPFKYKVAYYLKHIISILSSLLILAIIFNKINYRKFSMYIFSVLISLALSFYFYPNLINKFIIFEGGNDGLLYVHFAHLISDFLSVQDFKGAFMGGEEAYDLMPFYRYVWVIYYLLFNESPWIIFFIVTFLPIILFSILKNLLGKSWAIFAIFCWFLFPLFEAFGFFHFYYVKLSMRGFAEPLSYLLFFSSLALIISIYKNKNLIHKNENSFYFFISFLLSMSLGLRANLLPAFLVLILFIFFSLLKEKNFKGLIFLGIGLLPCLVMPIHNYYFTKKFIPLTIAAYKDWNLGAKPIDYIMLLISIAKINFDFSLWKKIVSHVSGEIKIYEIWYHASILSNIYIAFNKKSSVAIRLISWSAISLLFLIFFYHVGGRYSYLTWSLSLIVFLYWMQNSLFPFIKKLKTNHAS